jgi:hypothetical protein
MSLRYIYILFMRYMFRRHRAIFRKHIIKESTVLCNLSIVFLKYVVIIIVNFGVTGCLFFLSFVLGHYLQCIIHVYYYDFVLKSGVMLPLCA